MDKSTTEKLYYLMTDEECPDIFISNKQILELADYLFKCGVRLEEYAYWEERVLWNGNTPDVDIGCSNCGELYGCTDWNYCPKCGARMKEKD